ncbi:hypothetical protein ACFW2X_24860 [Streptomyces antibioticus]|uniref:hypothetical protein n=1 Tax=Streptomyces antibioticus TaxID=1890 RepID=UPI0036C8BB66
MPADEVTHGTDVEASTPVRTGPRHAAPKKPLFTRFHMPAGKAIALAAMPTAVLMGMGFTPTLANAEDQPTSKSLTIDEYKECVAALEGADASASASPSPSASASTDDAKDSEGSKDSEDKGSDSATGGSKDTSSGSGGSSSDSGSDEEAEPAPSASSAASAGKPASSSGDTATATPSATETEKKNVLETIGDAIGDLFDGGKSADETPAPTETPSASAGTGDDATSDPGTGSSDSGSGSSGSVSSGGSGAAGESKDKDSKDSKDSKDAGDTKDTVTGAVKDAADEATASPSASPSESADDAVDDCPVATLDESGVDNKTPVADDPWYLNASSLLLKGADYQGVVEVKTANGTRKKVLKYVISGGTDIGDLHQTVEDKQSGKTYHVQASSGSTSTIRDGDTIMYTQSISGNLFGLIPVTFDPDNPPPLNIPLIYFTKVKVVQAAQMGGNLHIPGMHVYTD